MPNYLARVAAATLGASAPADLPAVAPPLGGDRNGRAAETVDVPGPTSGDGTEGAGPPAAVRAEAGPPNEASLGAFLPAAAAPPTSTIPIVGALLPDDRNAERRSVRGAGRPTSSTDPAVVPEERPPLDERAGNATGARSAPSTLGPGDTETQAPDNGRALPTSVEPGRRHVIRVPPSLRPGSRQGDPERDGGTTEAPDYSAMRALATLLASPVVEEDSEIGAVSSRQPAAGDGGDRGDRGSPGAIQASGVPATGVAELPDRVEPGAASRRGTVVADLSDSTEPAVMRNGDRQRDGAAWHLSVGRVEVQVENRAPPAQPSRQAPASVPVDPLAHRFVDRFRLRL